MQAKANHRKISQSSGGENKHQLPFSGSLEGGECLGNLPATRTKAAVLRAVFPAWERMQARSIACSLLQTWAAKANMAIKVYCMSPQNIPQRSGKAETGCRPLTLGRGRGQLAGLCPSSPASHSVQIHGEPGSFTHSSPA